MIQYERENACDTTVDQNVTPTVDEVVAIPMKLVSKKSNPHSLLGRFLRQTGISGNDRHQKTYNDDEEVEETRKKEVRVKKIAFAKSSVDEREKKRSVVSKNSSIST
jgi:hypothetical protein